MTEDERGAERRDIVRGWVRRVLPWILLAGMAWLVLGNLSGRALVETGTQAPALNAQVSTGEAFDLEAHRGEIVIVNFWATWCGPCRAEAPTLTRIHNRLAQYGGMVLGISADRMPLDQVAQHALGLGMQYPIARTDEETFDRFRVTELPTTYVVAPSGEIVWSYSGAVDEERLSEVIQNLL